LPQRSTVETSRSVSGTPPSLLEGTAQRRANTAHVVVAWSPVNDGGTPSLEPTRVELEAELGTPVSTTWTCRTPSDSDWAEALSSARCSEVLLTALNDDEPSKHLVLELAGLLTLKLAATQPLIRVRFLPPSEHVTKRAKRCLTRCGTGLNVPRKR
jgi:hypothetical protein